MAQPKRAVSVDAWKHAAVREVELQSGAGIVRQRPGTLAQAIRGGRVPNPLLELAVRVEYRGMTDEEVAGLSAEQAAAWEEFKNWYIAETLVEPQVTPEDVAELPVGDREQLWRSAWHMFDAIGDAVRSLAEYQSFRERARGAEASGDGARDGQAAERTG